MENKWIHKITRMSASVKFKNVLAIFVLFVMLLLFSPKGKTQRFFKSHIGRIFLVGCVAFFASHHIVLGICALFLIMWYVQKIQSTYIMEGMTDETTAAMKEKTDKVKESVKKTADDVGIDREAIAEVIKSKPSNELPIPPSTATEDVSPTTAEAFTASYSYL